MEHDTILAGRHIRLRPLAASDAAALLPFVDDDSWFGMTSPTPRTEGELAAMLEFQRSAPDRIPFAVTDLAGQVRGMTILYDLVPNQQRVELGFTLYGRPYWGGVTNPEAKLLVLGYAFDSLDCYRVALRADARNARSLAAIRRLGAVHEGTLRGHRIAADGSRGDTEYFSILAPQWPEIRQRLLDRCAGFDRSPGFDDAG